MNFPEHIAEQHPGAGRWAVVHGYRGSLAHGMYVPSSDPDSIDDIDTMAICVPPLEHYCGLAEFGSRGTQEIKLGEWDVVVYEARKALSMLERGNPNVLSLLWLPSERYIATTAAGERLLEERALFAGRHVYKSFVGYATDQLAKMQRGAFQGYMGERRKALVRRHGYDTKNAAHLIRLLRMGIEFLQSGELLVDRTGRDAEELLAIKRGEWALERVEREAERLFERAEEAHARSALPEAPDHDRVSALCVEIVRGALAETHSEPPGGPADPP